MRERCREPPPFADAGNGDFFKNAGKQYLGARIAFGYNKRRRDLGRHACKDYMYKGGAEVGVDEKRWKEVLKAAESMLIWEATAVRILQQLATTERRLMLLELAD